MKKLASFSALASIFSINSVFANTPTDVVTDVFSIIGDIFVAIGVQAGRGPVLEGVLLVFTFLGLFKLFDGLLQNVPALTDHGKGTRAISVALAFITIGGMYTAVREKDSFVGLYGTGLLAILLLAAAIGVLIWFFKDVDFGKEKDWLKYSLGAGLIIIVYGITSAMLYYLYDGKLPVLVEYFNNWISVIIAIAIIGAFFAALFALLGNGLGKKGDRIKTPWSGEEREKRRADKIKGKGVSRAYKEDKGTVNKIKELFAQIDGGVKEINTNFETISKMGTNSYWADSNGRQAYDLLRQKQEAIVNSLSRVKRANEELANLKNRYERGASTLSPNEQTKLTRFTRNNSIVQSKAEELSKKLILLTSTVQKAKVGDENKDPSKYMAILTQVQDVLKKWEYLQGMISDTVKTFEGIQGEVVRSEDISSISGQIKNYGGQIASENVRAPFLSHFKTYISSGRDNSKLAELRPSIDSVSYYAIVLKDFYQALADKKIKVNREKNDELTTVDIIDTLINSNTYSKFVSPDDQSNIDGYVKNHFVTNVNRTMLGRPSNVRSLANKVVSLEVLREEVIERIDSTPVEEITTQIRQVFNKKIMPAFVSSIPRGEEPITLSNYEHFLNNMVQYLKVLQKGLSGKKSINNDIKQHKPTELFGELIMDEMLKQQRTFDMKFIEGMLIAAYNRRLRTSSEPELKTFKEVASKIFQ